MIIRSLHTCLIACLPSAPTLQTHTACIPLHDIYAGYDYMGVFQKAKDANGAILDITLLPLLTQQLQQATAQGTQYQWVIIMAGINDLGAGNRTAAAIMPKLIEVCVRLYTTLALHHFFTLQGYCCALMRLSSSNQSPPHVDHSAVLA